MRIALDQFVFGFLVKRGSLFGGALGFEFLTFVPYLLPAFLFIVCDNFGTLWKSVERSNSFRYRHYFQCLPRVCFSRDQ